MLKVETSSTHNARAASEETAADRVVAKAARRLIPFLVAGFFVAYLDRVNIGFAALTMNEELGFTPEFFGWAAGVFFIGYCLFEAPSNYILHRVGARIWIARIMASWGVVAALTAFVWSETSFVALRLLLGVAEAGFAPGVILYLTYWIPAAQRARILAGFLLAVPVSSAIGAPLSGLILTTMDGVGGISGWRWLFFVEALPAIALGVIAFFYLPDTPRAAGWLNPAERALLQARLEAERPAGGKSENHWRALRSSRVLSLGLVYFGVVVSLYGVGFWLPQIVSSFGYGVVATGFLTAVPFVFGALAMAVWSRVSDALNERAAHTIAGALLASFGLAASAYAQTPVLAMAALSIACVGTLAAMPTFWSLATLTLTDADVVVGIALINSIGNLAGFVGPYFVGWMKGANGDFTYALLGLAIGPLLSASLLWRVALGGSRSLHRQAAPTRRN